ncbi:MAG: DUF2191 domain-containing protein [Acidobacteriota bacterium]
MKTTIELPDDLFVAAKQRAAAERTTLRALVERGLRAQLGAAPSPRRPKKVTWVTVDGGLPPVDLADRPAMHDWLRRVR